MKNDSLSRSWIRFSLAAGVVVSLVAALAFTDGSTAIAKVEAGIEGQQQQADMQKILRGRQLVLEHACAACHGGAITPDGKHWMAGLTASMPGLEFLIGPCVMQPGAQPCFRTRPRNLTPDNLTGMGRFSERQIFNALRFGLRPGETEDVDITSTTPGQGNFPANPKYLAPPMPWMAWRHMSDDELRAIAAYLKYGVKPVRNVVEDSEGPPDFWKNDYAGMLQANPSPVPAFPTANEVRPTNPSVDMQKVLRGRHVAIQHDCGACHGGLGNPANNGWLAGVGVAPGTTEFPAGPPDQPAISGPCSAQSAGTKCWMMRPRNLTPHATTGIGQYTDRQLFNALRYGLRPSTSPDVEITSSVPGQGNFPANPDYLGLGMPWPAWRFMSDEDLWALIAYLKHGLKPVDNKVADSEAPPDKWAGVYTIESIGPYPAPSFPTANEIRR
jgi:mono/diheme cytochrome c family protein